MKHAIKLKHGNYFALCMLLLVSHVSSQNKSAPPWVRMQRQSLRYPAEYYLTGFGVSDRKGELSLKFMQAQDRALEDLAKRIEVKIDSELKDEWIETSEGRQMQHYSEVEGSITSTIKSSVAMTLQGVQIERYIGGIIYALAV